MPEGTTYTVKELVDGEDAGSGGVDELADTGSEEGEESWKTFVQDSGAENTEKVEASETSGTIPESGIANVQFTNTLPGGPAHLIVDYNLNGATATYDKETGTITSDTVVECGTHSVGDTIEIQAALNGQTLEPNVSSIVIGQVNGENIEAKFLGLYPSPSSGQMLNYKGNGIFEHTLGHEDLTVIYAHWEIGSKGSSIKPPEGSEGELYTVFWGL